MSNPLYEMGTRALSIFSYFTSWSLSFKSDKTHRHTNPMYQCINSLSLLADLFQYLFFCAYLDVVLVQLHSTETPQELQWE